MLGDPDTLVCGRGLSNDTRSLCCSISGQTFDKHFTNFTNMRLLVKNIGQLVTVVEGEEVCLAGKDMGQIKVRAA